MKLLCTISTRGRYNTTLPLAIQAVAMQTAKIDRLIIFDDNEFVMDLTRIFVYQRLFQILESKGIEVMVMPGCRKGQQHNHQLANKAGYDWVWRIDDDTIPEPNVLSSLLAFTSVENVGAIGGSVLIPGMPLVPSHTGSSLIADIHSKHNSQWGLLDGTEKADHLHCSFLYRAGVVDYELSLSRIGQREETIFTHELHRKGYHIVLTPCVTWHLEILIGGRRDGRADVLRELFDQDEQFFKERIKRWQLEDLK